VKDVIACPSLMWVIQIGLHLFLNAFYGVYSSLVSADRFVNPDSSEARSTFSNSFLKSGAVSPVRRANATFVFLCRNSDLEGVVSSIVQIEDRFNRRHGYPWVLLNEEPFTDSFKKCAAPTRFRFLFLLVDYRRIEVLTSSPVSFGIIPKEHWFQPDWIDEEKATQGRLKLMLQGIIYAGVTVALMKESILIFIP
jgi:alpha 1,2-mannosyltransferase